MDEDTEVDQSGADNMNSDNAAGDENHTEHTSTEKTADYEHSGSKFNEELVNSEMTAPAADAVKKTVFRSDNDELKSLVECPICLESFTDPRMLVCQHSFCLKCLQDHVTSTADSNIFSCPVCREKCAVPDKGTDNQPKNIFLNNLSSILEKTVTVSKHEVVCSLEECGGRATHCCFDGCDFLCQACLNFHNRAKISKGHKVIAVKDICTDRMKNLISQTAIPTCDQHSPSPLNLYCKQCETLLCGTCFFIEHQGHPCINLSSQPDEVKAQLHQLIQKTKHCLNIVKGAIETTRKEKVATEKDFDSLENLVMDTIKKLHDYIDKIKDDFVQKMIDMKKQVLKKVECVAENQDLLQTGLESLYNYQTSVSVHGSVWDSGLQMASMKQRLGDLTGFNLMTFSWKYNIALSTLNSLSQFVPDAKLTECSVPSHEEVPDDLTATILSIPECEHSISGFTLYRDHLVVVHKLSDKLFVYNTQGDLVQTCTVSDMCNPQHMTIVFGDEDVIEITDVAPHKEVMYALHLLSFNKGTFNLSGNCCIYTCPYHTRGLSSSSDGEVIAVNSETNTFYHYPIKDKKTSKSVRVRECLLKGSVPIIPHYGKSDSESPEKYDIQQSLVIQDPCNSRAYIAIARQARQIVWLNKKGKVDRRTDVAACDMVLDGQELLLVVDGQTDVITVFSLQTDFQMTLPVDPPLRAPSRICLDGLNKQLYVVHQTKTRDTQEIVSLPYPRDWIMQNVQSYIDACAAADVDGDVSGAISQEDVVIMPRKTVECYLTATVPQIL